MLLNNRVYSEATANTPAQYVSELVAFDLKSARSTTLLSKMPLVAPVWGGGALTYGLMGGRPAIYFMGLSLGPMYTLFAADPDTGGGMRLTNGSLDDGGWAVTPSGEIVAQIRFDPGDKRGKLLVFNQGKATPVALPEKYDSPVLTGLGRTPDTVALTADGDLLEASTATTRTVRLQPNGFRSEDVFEDHDTNRLVAATFSGDPHGVLIFDDRLAASWSNISSHFRQAEVRLIDFDQSRSQVLFSVEEPSISSYYWYDAVSAQYRLIGSDHPALQGKLGAVKRFDFKARDGLPLTAYVTVPPGKALRNLPAIVWVHGFAGYNDSLSSSEAQAFASRGYAVIAVNYRGTSGLGEALAAAGAGQLGQGMQTDLDDAVTTMSEAGMIDKDRTCIGGVSYGGYAALEAAVTRPTFYHCAIAWGAPLKLDELVRMPDSGTRGGVWREARRWRTAVGEANLGLAPMRRLSIVDNSAQIKSPILLLYQNISPTSSDSLADRMTRSMKSAGQRVDLIKLPLVTKLDDLWKRKLESMTDVLAFLEKNNPV